MLSLEFEKNRQTKTASFLPISKCQANADYLNVIFTSQKEVENKFQISLVFNCEKRGLEIFTDKILYRMFEK